VNLILSKPDDCAWEDLQLTDEHGALVVVSSNTKPYERDLLVPKEAGLLLQNFHCYETIAGKIKIFLLVVCDGFILIIILGVKSENLKMVIYRYMLKVNVSSHCYYFPIR